MTLQQEKKYHIYLNDNCIYHSLSEEDFKTVWNVLNRLNEFLAREKGNSIQYEEVQVNKEILLESSY